MRPLETLGHWAESLRWSDVPEAARHRARLAFRDTLGTILGGAATRAGRIATTTAQSAPGPTGIAGTTACATPTLAAFATAVHASALDFDDGHYRGGAIHPGSVVVSALLVAMQSVDCTPDDVLTAQVVGYEIGLRAAHLLWPRHADDDYHCTGTAGALAAAAAVAKLRGYGSDRIDRAVAVAWAHAPMSTFQLPMVKESIGWSAASGCFAADLAAAGFMRADATPSSAMDGTFPPTPFHRRGAMTDPFVASLGATFESANTYFKPYAACRYTHTAARTLQLLIERNALTAADIEHVDVHTPRAAMHLTDAAPASLEHAQYSFPFVLAAIMSTGAAGAAEICDDRLHDRQQRTLMSKVSVHHDQALDAEYPAHYGSRLVARLRDGSVHEEVRLAAPGDPDDPMSVEELDAKFARLVDGAPPDAVAALPAVALDIVHGSPTRSLT